MDLILFQRMSSCHSFFPKTSILSSRLTLLFTKSAKVRNSQNLTFLVKHTDNVCLSFFDIQQSTRYILPKLNVDNKVKATHYCTSTKSNSSSESIPPGKDGYNTEALEKLSIFQKMKQLTKDYWHILIPVHIMTSAGWLSMFYIAAKNGVDIVGILQSLNLSERYLDMLRNSNAGHWAITYALYKIFTPLRYTVTIGGTTMCIRYLNKWGYLKFKRDLKQTKSVKYSKGHPSTSNKP